MVTALLWGHNTHVRPFCYTFFAIEYSLNKFRISNSLASVLQVDMWNFTLVIFWSLAAQSSSVFAPMLLANCRLLPSNSRLVFHTSFAGLSEPKQGERSQGDQKQRKGTKPRQGAPFNCEPDGSTRQSHPTEEERDRWGGGVSSHKHTHTWGEGIVINR